MNVVTVFINPAVIAVTVFDPIGIIDTLNTTLTEFRNQLSECVFHRLKYSDVTDLTVFFINIYIWNKWYYLPVGKTEIFSCLSYIIFLFSNIFFIFSSKLVRIYSCSLNNCIKVAILTSLFITIVILNWCNQVMGLKFNKKTSFELLRKGIFT